MKKIIILIILIILLISCDNNSNRQHESKFKNYEYAIKKGGLYYIANRLGDYMDSIGFDSILWMPTTNNRRDFGLEKDGIYYLISKNNRSVVRTKCDGYKIINSKYLVINNDGKYSLIDDDQKYDHEIAYYYDKIIVFKKKNKLFLNDSSLFLNFKDYHPNNVNFMINDFIDSCPKSDISIENIMVDNGLMIIKVNNKYGIFNGYEYIYPQFDKLNILSEELISFKVKDKWGLLFTKRLLFDYLPEKYYSKTIKEIFVGRSDFNYILPPKFDSILLDNGKIIFLLNKKCGIFELDKWTRDGKRYGYQVDGILNINKENYIYLDYCDEIYTTHKLIIGKKDSKIGILNLKEKEFTAYQCDYLFPLTENTLLMQKENHWYLTDSNMRIKVNLNYENLKIITHKNLTKIDLKFIERVIEKNGNKINEIILIDNESYIFKINGHLLFCNYNTEDNKFEGKVIESADIILDNEFIYIEIENGKLVSIDKDITYRY